MNRHSAAVVAGGAGIGYDSCSNSCGESEHLYD
jgi:hypothetical protein